MCCESKRRYKDDYKCFYMLFTEMGETRRISALRKGRGGINSPVSGNSLAY